MQERVKESLGAIEEYRQKAHVGDNELQFERLPRERFCVSKSTFPKVVFECRPDYDARTLGCNMTRIDSHESEPVERVFNLTFTVDALNGITLTEGHRTLHRVEEAVEALLRHVCSLYPALKQH